MNKRILVVDDEIFTLRMMEKKLQSKDCIVDASSNSKEALELMNSNKYDAIILDVDLPDISGLELLKMKNRSINEINKKTPTIMVSSSVDYATVSEAMENGAFDYIIKSFHLDRLNDLLESIDTYGKAKEAKAV